MNTLTLSDKQKDMLLKHHHTHVFVDAMSEIKQGDTVIAADRLCHVRMIVDQEHSTFKKVFLVVGGGV